MLLKLIKQITAEEAKEKLTEHEYNLLKYYQGNNKSKDINQVCIELAMSKQRLAKTKRSLESKLSRLVQT